MITSHRSGHACQNYGYFSRSLPERHLKSPAAGFVISVLGLRRAELIRSATKSGPNLSVGALIRGLSRRGARWGGTR